MIIAILGKNLGLANFMQVSAKPHKSTKAMNFGADMVILIKNT